MLKSVCLLSVLACAPCAQAGELTETAHVCPADAIRKDCRPAEKDRLFHSQRQWKHRSGGYRVC